MKTVRTKKGSELPLINLKGKDYLMVAYRLQWLTEDVENYTIDTTTTAKTEEYATVMAKVCINDKAGELVKSATARKTEFKREFGDFEEKAETGAIGRALAMLGFGTQHAIADLDEGTRIVDSPVVNPKTAQVEAKATTPSPTLTEAKKGPGRPAKAAAAVKTPALANGYSGNATNGKTVNKPEVIVNQDEW